MKKITYLIGLLFGLFLSLSINAQTTINFNSGTALAHNTDYGSNVITVGNFKFTYNDATWFGSTYGNGNTMALEALTTSTAPGQSQSITVETNDGSEFDFQSFWLDILSFTGNENWTLEGFKDGVSIGTQVISVIGNSSSGYIQIVSPNSTFDNVDKVTITAGATGFFYFDIFDDFVFGSALTNTAPTAVANTGSSLSEGGTDIVSSSELRFADVEEPDTDITYTLDDLPDNGTLRKNTVALTLGGTFTQDDINNNRIDYVHDGSDTTSDSFRVDVSDGQGGTIYYQTFNFTIAAVDDTAPSFQTSTPYYSNVTQTRFTLTTNIDEAGDIFYVVLADGATAPTSLEVVNGTGNAGAAAVTSDNASVTTGVPPNDFSVTGLTAGTDYDVYVVARDDEGTPNLQGSPTKLDVTTEELISLTITGLTGSNKTYNGTTAASASGTATLVGVEAGGDDVFLGGSPVFTFASANVGTGITITTSGYTISGTDAGNYTLTQPTLSGDITAKELTITGISGGDKVYDGTTAATASGTATLVGVEAGDDVFLGGSPVFTFASANVGTGITINTSGYTINGTDSGNYTLTQPTLSGDITAKELTITGITGGDKVYDDTTAATATGTATLSGIIGADDVFLGGSPVFTFASANVGTGITMFTSGYTISGTDSGNYTLTQPTLSGDITGKEVTITGISGGDKVYDGTTAATASGTATLVGVEAGDDVFLGGSPVFTFASANVGTGITMFTSGYTISGTDSGNYTLTQPTLSGDITGKEVTITGISGGDKVYDGTTAATASGTATLVGVEAGDDVFLGGSPVFTFASANVGTGITINTSGYAISGTDSGNYTLTQPTLSGDIIVKELTITGITGGDKVYDDTTSASASGTATLVGVEAGDDVFLGGSPVFTFASANVGTGITINTSGYTINGTDSGNYTLTQPTLSGDIIAKELTITGITGGDKVYDDTTAASASGTATLIGVEAGDDVFLGGSPVFTFASANVGTGITINTSGYTINGTDSGNYTLTQPTLSGDITAAPLTVTASDQTKVYGTTDPVLIYSITGFVNGDLESDLDTGVSISRAVGEAVGTYTITPSAATDSNYAISFVTADFTITAADLTVTASDQTKVYGATDPALTYSITGFVNGDTEDDLDTSVSILRGAGETVGTYSIIAFGAAASNYTVSFVTSDFTITPAALTVTADADQTKVYGATEPTLTFTITGFVNGDTEANLDTGVSISRAVGEAVGTYTITPSAATDSNYAISFVTADFSITAAPLAITGLTGNNKVYDGTTDATASGTPVLSGVVSDDDVVLGGTPDFTFASAELGTDIQITTTGFFITGADSGNYILIQPTLSADIVTTLGVDDITDVKFSLKLYPNPAINYIRVLGLSEKANYIIYNLLGKKVGKGIVRNDEDITIQNLSNGTYFIRIENAKAIKFIKI